MIQRGLLPDFSPAVLTETASLTAAAGETGPSIRDLRDRLWCSIDNDDSRDLDQLTVAEPLSGGAVKIFVAVADVDALVRSGSAIDGHARTNTTSVYTAAEIFPMLPERLSTDLTSLGEGQARAALVIEMAVAADGTVTASDVYRGVVLNQAKLAYNSVAAWLEGTGPAPPRLAAVPGLDAQLRVQDKAAQAMKALRHQRGALSLESLETRAVFDGDRLADLRPDEKNRAKELIEDFMIAANGVTAKYLEGKGLPSLRRVLRVPERWGRIVDLAAGLGEPPAGRARCAGARRIPRRAAPGGSCPVPRPLPLRDQAPGLGRVRRRAARSVGGRPLRARREGLLALHGAQSAVSGSDHGATAEGGDRGEAGAVL